MSWHETDIYGQPSRVVTRLIDLYERQVIATEKQATALTSIAVTMALRQTAVPVVSDIDNALGVQRCLNCGKSTFGSEYYPKYCSADCEYIDRMHRQPYVQPPKDA